MHGSIWKQEKEVQTLELSALAASFFTPSHFFFFLSFKKGRKHRKDPLLDPYDMRLRRFIFRFSYLNKYFKENFTRGSVILGGI